MKVTFVGFAQSAGEFVDERTGEVKPFDSIVMDCLTSSPPKGGNIKAHAGKHYRKIKLRTSDLEAVFDGYIKTPAELADLVGSVLNIDGTMYNTKSGSYVSADEIYVVE